MYNKKKLIIYSRKKNWSSSNYAHSSFNFYNYFLHNFMYVMHILYKYCKYKIGVCVCVTSFMYINIEKVNPAVAHICYKFKEFWYIWIILIYYRKLYIFYHIWHKYI